MLNTSTRYPNIKINHQNQVHELFNIYCFTIRVQKWVFWEELWKRMWALFKNGRLQPIQRDLLIWLFTWLQRRTL